MTFRVAGLALVAGIAYAQTQPSFDVESIKPSGPASPGPVFDVKPGGNFVASRFTLRNLIRVAYNIHLAQILGGPGWIDTEMYDVSAKPATPPKSGEMRLMVQSLLAERFRLVIKRETRELPVYALTIAKGGPKFREAKESDPNIIGPPSPAGSPRSHTSRLFRGRYIAQGGRISWLTDRLTDMLDRTVVDKTGLTGDYDMKLEWAPDENQVAMFQKMGVPEGPTAPLDSQGPALFTALKEQLGLNLESQRGPLEVFVIERAERPSEN